MAATKSYCLNCDAALRDTDEYCSQCGQRVKERLTFGFLLSNIASTFFSFDSKLMNTLPTFLLQPGIVPLNFVKGKRKQYFSPIAMYVFLSFLFFLLFTNILVKKWDNNIGGLGNQINVELLNEEGKEKLVKNLSVEDQEEIMQIFNGSPVFFQLDIPTTDSLIKLGYSNAEIIEYQTVNDEENNEIFKNALINFVRTRGKGSILILFSQLSFVFILKLIVLGFCYALFYRKLGFRLPEHFVQVLYGFNFILFLSVVCLLLYSVWPSTYWWYVFIVFFPVYLFIHIKQFYGQSFVKSLVKFISIFILSSLIIVPISTIIVIFFSLLQIAN